MKIRRLRILLLSLFLLATVASALHTIEHHDGHDNCPVCTVAGHTAAPDVIAPYQALTVLPGEVLPLFPDQSNGRLAVHFTPSRAPPSFSI